MVFSHMRDGATGEAFLTFASCVSSCSNPFSDFVAFIRSEFFLGQDSGCPPNGIGWLLNS
jgi:hypothetical protein